MELKVGNCLYILENEDIYRYIKSLEAENKKYKELIDKAIAHLDLFILSENLSEYDTLKILMHTKKILSEVE